MQDEWNTGTEAQSATNCDYCVTRAKIVLSDTVMAVIDALCKRIKDEWQLLLIGTDDGIEVHCTDYYVPKQEYGSAHVHNLDCIDKEFIESRNVVATIHSHSDFGVFFSHTDEDKTNKSLIRNHIVVNNKGEFCATKRVDLPCGLRKFVDADVTREMPKLPTIKRIKGFKNLQKAEPIICPAYRAQQPMGYGTIDAFPGLRKKHAVNMDLNYL